MKPEKIITLKPGEVVTMIATTEEITEAHDAPTTKSDAGARTIESDTEAKETKPKKKRDTKKEAAWAKEKYAKFSFAISKTNGEKLIAYLDREGVKPFEWFKHMVKTTLEDADWSTTDEDTSVVSKFTSEVSKPKPDEPATITYEKPFENQVAIDESYWSSKEPAKEPITSITSELEPEEPAEELTTSVVWKSTSAVWESSEKPELELLSEPKPEGITSVVWESTSVVFLEPTTIEDTSVVSKFTSVVLEPESEEPAGEPTITTGKEPTTKEAKKWKMEREAGISWRQLAKFYRRDWRTIKKAVENLK